MKRLDKIPYKTAILGVHNSHSFLRNFANNNASSLIKASMVDRIWDDDSAPARKLLVIAPHFKVFIRDQVVLIRPHFSKTIVLIPTPLFSSLTLKMPLVKRYFRFLSLAVESRLEVAKDLKLVFPKFFTLPFEALRKRNCYLAAQSCKRALSKCTMNLSLIHAHFLQNGFIGAAFKNLLAIPLIVTAHGGEVYDLPFRNSWYENLARYVLSEADAIITVSQFNAKKLSSLGISSYNLHVIPNGYDEKLFKPVSLCEARKKVGLPLSKKILLSVGNLVDIKGHTYLVDAMKIVAKRRHDTILVVVGTGSLKENLQRKARKLSLNGKILFIGEKEHREIPLWMNACDLFVLPSLGEGFPTVIPEAMACGKPIIGTSVGGVPEAISSNELGTLVPSRDSEALSQAILEGLNCEWSQEEILNKAKNYSWNSIIKQILAVYDKVLLKNNLHFNATSAVAT